MKRIFAITVGISLFLAGFNSCKQSTINSLLPGVSGSAYEVLIVIGDGFWDGTVGDSIKDVLRREQVALPQPEPIFSVSQIPHKALTDFTRQHRNLLITNISSEVEKPAILFKKDVWSAPQVVIKINAPDRQSFLKLLSKYKEKITQAFLEAEKKRLMSNYRKYQAEKISETLRKRHNVSLIVPKGYSLDMDTKDFVWLAYETKEISQGIFVYHYNYTDTNTFTPGYLIAKRDSFLKHNVHIKRAPRSKLPKAYMTTEHNYKVESKAFEHNGEFAMEIRGLWRAENDFMGGPFISLSKVDEVRNRVVTVEGFVFAPKKNKRNLLRQVEAIVYSMKIPKPEKQE